jgi:hypothetical protein
MVTYLKDPKKKQSRISRICVSRWGWNCDKHSAEFVTEPTLLNGKPYKDSVQF